MKKQFFRVKQLADQTFSRAGKTEALSDDLQDAERRVEFIRTICQIAGKKIGNPSTGHDPAAREKRLKKNPDYCFGSSMVECASSEDDRLLRQIVTDCGTLQVCLAKVLVEHEIKIENNVVNPLLGVCDNDYPNILKVKRNLSKLILDMDSARARYHQAMKHVGAGGGAGSKVESIRDELEEAESKVEQCRDQLACEMLQLIARESELSLTILEYARLQKNYHEAAAAILDKIIPEMETAINISDMRPMFGLPLEEHLRVTKRKIAYPIELCVCGVLELGIAEEGLFRVAPANSKLKRMKLSLDAHCLSFEAALQQRDPHVFTGVLKSYLRELPDPLLTHQLYEQWMAAAKVVAGGNQDEGLNAVWKVVHSLPQANFDNLQYLIKFFSSLASNKHINKMTPQNIAIVLAPNLIWSPNEDSNNIGQNMTTANLHSVIVDTLVTFSDWFFPGEMEFYVTLSKDVGSFLNGHSGSENQATSDQEMKRTHSNDSLSEHSSPPHGSPKPAVRSRKQKPVAPNPPGHHSKEKDKGDSKSEKYSNRDSRDMTKSHDRPKEKPPRDKSGETVDVKEVKQTKDKEISRVDKATSPRQIVKQIDSSPTKENSKLETTPVKEDIKKIEPKTETSDKENNPEKSTPLSMKSLENETDEIARNMNFAHFDARRGSSGELNRRTSKSGEDIRKSKVEEGGFCTLRKPPRPMPRTVVGEGAEKPAIPERPPQLQRPLSFRLPKSPESPDEHNVSLERTHMYSVDKQQVAIIQVTPDKVPNEKTSGGGELSPGEKPEKPKKPESLMCQPGHHRAASEGSIIDTGMSRPPRPTPPPPPVLTSPKKESTDL